MWLWRVGTGQQAGWARARCILSKQVTGVNCTQTAPIRGLSQLRESSALQVQGVLSARPHFPLMGPLGGQSAALLSCWHLRVPLILITA